MSGHDDEKVPMVVVEQMQPSPPSTSQLQQQHLTNPENPFEEMFDPDFWKDVATTHDNENKRRKKLNKERESNQQIPQISRNEVETRLRLAKLEKSYNNNKTDDDEILFLTYLLTTHYDRYVEGINHPKVAELKDSYIKQLSGFAIILLKEDFSGKHLFDIYEDDDLKNKDDDDDDDDDEKDSSVSKKTNIKRKYEDAVLLPSTSSNKLRKASVLHIAAERSLCDIAKIFIDFYPSTVSKSDQPRKDLPLDQRQTQRIPVQVALDCRNDDVCAIIMKSMTNERVRELFHADKPERVAQNKLTDFIKDNDMKKTVLCVLDACINPNFPNLHENENQKKERSDKGEEIWANIPDIPLQYNFFFRILDGDSYGRPAKIFDDVTNKDGHRNTEFAHNSASALQVIANSSIVTREDDENEDLDPILHPVVRQLVRGKWKSYGRQTVIFYLIMYLLFLLNLSIALILGAMSEEPTSYGNNVDKLRGFCEFIMLVFTLYYILAEAEQVWKERGIYCSDHYNKFDIVGLLSIIILIPCRFAKAQTTTSSISVVAFFINFIRVFKFAVALPREYGVYVKTFAQIFYTDIKKFAVVFLVVMMAFTGSVYIALIASKSLDDDFSNFLDVLLQELRALMEGKEFADSYSSYNVLLTLFLLMNMAAIIVILSNILIGQLSYRYETASEEAAHQYDIDKAKWVTSLEKSWFPCEIFNNRTKHYKDGIFVSKKEMDANLLVYWDKQINTEDEAKNAVRSMLEKKILKRN